MSRRTTIAAAALVLLYTALISGADAVAKLFAQQYSAPQLFFVAGGLVSLACVAIAFARPAPVERIGTTCPWLMTLRAIFTVIASWLFFEAFARLALAEVFLFIGLMPVLAGLMSRPILKEPVSPAAWVALGAGCIGVAFLFPDGLRQVLGAHVIAFGACLAGTVSMVLSRLIGRHEQRPLAQVFWPNLALCLVMALALPFTWSPFTDVHVLMAVAYAALLFLARYVIVRALDMMSAHAVMALINLQFVWMVVIGFALFDDLPSPGLVLGALIVIGASMLLLADHARLSRIQGPPRPLFRGFPGAGPAG